MIIEIIDEGAVFTKENTNKFNIASDFQFKNSEGKLTVPWFDYGAFLELSNHQKKIIRYSVIQQMELNEYKNDDESCEADSLTEIADEILAPDVKQVKWRTFKRRRQRRRALAVAKSADNSTIQDPQEIEKENSLFNYLREEKNSLKPYYLLSNNKYSLNKPKEQKYIRAYLPIPARRLNRLLEYENADYNHELEVMAYIESEDDPIEWKAAQQMPLQDSSFFMENQAIEEPPLPEVTDTLIEQSNRSSENLTVIENMEDSLSLLLQADEEITIEVETSKEKEAQNNKGINLGIIEKSMDDHVNDEKIENEKKLVSLSYLLVKLKNLSSRKEQVTPSVEDESLQQMSLLDSEQTSEDPFTDSNSLSTLLEESINTLEDESLPNYTVGEVEHIQETDSIIEEEAAETQSRIELEQIATEEGKENFEQNNLINGSTTNIKTKTIYIPFSTYVDIEEFLHPALYGSAKQEGYNFLPSKTNHFPLFDTIFFDSSSFFQEDLYCQLIGYKVHEILFTVNNPKKHKLSLEENNIYKSQARARHNSKHKGHKPPLAMHIKVPVIVGEYDVEISIKKALVLEERVVNIKELSKNIKLTACRFIPSSFQQSFEEGVQEATSGKLFIEGTAIQRIEYTILTEEEEKLQLKNQISKSVNIQQNAVIELVLQLLQIQKVYYPSYRY